MKKIILNTIKFIVDSKLWIALATALFYLLTLMQLGKKLELSATLIFLFSSSLFIYTLFQVLDKKNEQSIFSKVIILFSLMALLVCIPYLSYTTLIILMLSGLLTFFYATPLLSLGESNFNLRKIWFLKSVIVALVWTLTSAVVPLLEYDASEFQMIWFSVEKFLFILGITIPYDIKDLEKDKQEKGMTSFVMKYGIRKTKFISNIILAFAFVLAFYIYGQSILIISIPYVFAMYINSKLEKNTSKYWYTFLIDAAIILYFFSFWVFN